MNIFLTGAAGFIGFHTADRLLGKGHNLLCIDDLNNHYDPSIKYKRIEFLKQKYKNKFQFERVDIRNKDELEKFFKNFDIEVVINLAARAGVRNSVKNPWIYYETNLTGVLYILELIKKYNPSILLIQASTSSVYGLNKIPFDEEDKVDKPLSPYAASKKASEELCHVYHYLYGINILIFRFFTVYGTYGRPDMSIFRFIRWIDGGEELLLYGDGEQERDFTFVGDIVKAIEKGLTFKGFEIINLGNDNPVKINYVIKTIENLLEKKAKIKYLDRHPADVPRTCAKIDKARRILNWSPQIDIDTGLKIVVEWYKKEKDWVKEVKIDD